MNPNNTEEVKKLLKRTDVPREALTQEFLDLMFTGISNSNWKSCAVGLTGVYVFGTVLDKWKVIRQIEDVPEQVSDYMIQLLEGNDFQRNLLNDMQFWQFTKDPLQEGD